MPRGLSMPAPGPPDRPERPCPGLRHSDSSPGVPCELLTPDQFVLEVGRQIRCAYRRLFTLLHVETTVIDIGYGRK